MPVSWYWHSSVSLWMKIKNTPHCILQCLPRMAELFKIMPAFHYFKLFFSEDILKVTVGQWNLYIVSLIGYLPNSFLHLFIGNYAGQCSSVRKVDSHQYITLAKKKRVRHILYPMRLTISPLTSLETDWSNLLVLQCTSYCWWIM